MLHGEITTLDLIIVGLYLIAMIAIGVWFVRRIQNTEDYYVADHSFGPLVLMATVCATIIGGMIAGFAVCVGWKLAGLPFGLGAAVPGAIACAVALVCVSLATYKKHPSVFLEAE